MTSPITSVKNTLKVWYSELNYYMTKYNCETLQELEKILLSKGITLVVL